MSVGCQPLQSPQSVRPLLELFDVVAGYGALTVLHGVSLHVHAGERVCLIGRNGVGKSTTLKTIMGLTQWRTGQLNWCGQDITRMGTVARARLGLGYVPQTRDIFPSLSVQENLLAGLRGVSRRKTHIHLQQAYDWFPRLYERRRNGGGELSGGEQQMLAVARTLLGQPRLLLLDEPLEGLAPVICEELMQVFERLGAESGTAILLVEQKVQEALDFARRVLILDHGTVVHAGQAADLQRDSALIDRHVSVAGVSTAI